MKILDGISFNFGAIVLDSGWRSLGNTLHHAMITSTPLPIALQLCLDFPASVEEWPGSKHDMKMFIPHVHNSPTENGFENRFEIVILPMEDLKRFMLCHSSKIKTLYYYTDSRKFDKIC